MRTVLVAKFENRKDANAAARFIKTLRSKVKMLSDEQWEDLYFAQQIEKGMQENGVVSLDKIHRKLRK
ncbi:MAG TPA: hypothetical protein VI757_05365 [Bacteroidia bacterium]|nr:hypothetical protein [Bacteroidia bacterium]